MALVTISGYPACGKTRRAVEVMNLLRERQALPVYIVNDESVGLSRSALDDTKTEKPMRAAFFAAIVRLLKSDSIVIADGLNYIKGFRYQLYCAAREAKIRTCTSGRQICSTLQQRASRALVDPYARSLDNLIERFEEPSYTTRWDTPLFVVPHDGDLPGDGILAALSDQKLKPMPVATVAAKASSADYMRLLDNVTSQIVSSRLATGGNVTPAQLHRLKRQFVTIHRTAGVGTQEMDEPGMRRAFSGFLDEQLRV